VTRIVILGGGFGGATCAQALERHASALDLEIVLINRTNFFVFTPLLIEAGTGSLEPRHAVVPLRDFLGKTVFRAAEVISVDPALKKVRYRVVGKTEDDEIEFDHLVIALGSVTRKIPIPGLAEHAFEMKDLADAVALRDRAIQLLEQADATPDPEERKALLRFVVVGANFSGVEVAGEFQVFMAEAARHYRNVRPGECSMVLIEIAPRILQPLDEELARYAVEQMERRGTRVLLNTSVKAVRADAAVLSNGEPIPTRTVIWCAGVTPNPIMHKLGLPLDERGAVRARADLRVEGKENIWAIGDGAAIPDGNGKIYPPTAQHAVRQAAHLASNIAAALRGEPVLPCKLVSQGALAALGCRTAVAKVFGFRLSGFPAWFLWRSVYLMKMPGLARRVRVALDWTVDLFFAKPIVQLGVHRPKPFEP
jgi:NADH:ubiquinone reductase (H+-translocating)